MRGVGPVVIDERSKLPWRATHFSHTVRKIARAAGWPDDLWNTDSRAGAVSEAFEAGADLTDVRRTATHTQMATTMIYSRGGVVQSSRAPHGERGVNRPETRHGNRGSIRGNANASLRLL